jgi:hypothetical protein
MQSKGERKVGIGRREIKELKKERKDESKIDLNDYFEHGM